VQYLGKNAIDVLIDGKSVGAGGTLSVGSNWAQQSLSFVATAASQELSFKLANATKSYLSIDGISVQAAAVPEPATWALMSLTLVGVGVVKRYRRHGV
jgi:hypothetical protein